MTEFELKILDWIWNNLRSPLMDSIWKGITHLGDAGIIWLIITLGLLILPKTRKIGWTCALALLLGFITTNGILKNLVQRPRPFTYRDIELLIKAPIDYSFPSGHTTSSFAMVFALVLQRNDLEKNIGIHRKWILIPLLVLASLVAFSRIYLYVHFPTDVIGGLIIAYPCAYLSYYILNKKRE